MQGIWAFIFLALIFLSYTAPCMGEEHDGIKYTINIPQQKIGLALFQLSEAVNKQFFIRSSLAEGIYSEPVNGDYSLKEVLTLMLDSTGLKGEITHQGQIKISKDHGYLNTDFEPVIISEVSALEEVYVTGLRYSWLSSSYIKRSAVNFKEVLTEADMNKLPDGNVADTMQRMAGIQIERRNGDGTRFRIRGLDQNTVLFNGEAFLTGLEYFQLGLNAQAYQNSIETFPVEFLRRIEIEKSPRAADIEGGVGGTVNMISRSALDIEGYLVTADAKLDYGRFAKQSEPELFIGLGKNWHDKLALLVSLNHVKRSMHNDIAQNYVSRGIEEVFARGNISTFSDDNKQFDYLSPDYSSLLNSLSYCAVKILNRPISDTVIRVGR